MGLLVPDPGPHCVWSAGPNADGDFVIASKEGQFVQVPDKWKVPLAAWLLGTTTIFAPETFGALRDLEKRLARKRGKKSEQDERDVRFLGALAHALECLMHEYLEADPRTSTRYEYRPEYYQDRLADLRKRGLVPPERAEPERPKEELDDTPLPWT